MTLDKKDWTLMTISLAGDSGITPAQLQKSLFLLEKNYNSKLNDFYTFEPYNYGPFDKLVYVDARALADNGMIKMNGSHGKSWSKYEITEQGKVNTKQLIKEADTKMLNYLTRVVAWAQGLTFPQLISSIYKHYPDYKVNSVFREET